MGEAAGAGSLQSVYQAALSCVQDACGVERASILVFDAEGVMRFVAWSSLSARYRATVDGHSPWSPGATDATPIVVKDVLEDPSLKGYLIAFKQEGIRSLAFVPLRFGSKLLGKFMLYHEAPHEFTDDEILAAEQIADHVAIALEHHRVSVALKTRLAAEQVLRQQAETAAELQREGEHRLRLALAAGRMGTWEWDLTSNSVSWSAGVETIYDLDPGAFGNTLEMHQKHVHPADAPGVDAAIQAALAAGQEEFRIEYRLLHPDGKPRWVSGHGRFFFDQDGKAVRMLGVCRDITESKRNALHKDFLAEVSREPPPR
jgi:PAS domain S-box-containing protein